MTDELPEISGAFDARDYVLLCRDRATDMLEDDVPWHNPKIVHHPVKQCRDCKYKMEIEILRDNN
jgi:hypothetical protein